MLFCMVGVDIVSCHFVFINVANYVVFDVWHDIVPYCCEC